MTIFVSRHPGARDWVSGEGLRVDRFVAQLDPAEVAPGDVVVGTLPVHLAAAVCRCGARYFHLSLELPLQRRGRELTAEIMRACGARLEEYRIERCTADG